MKAFVRTETKHYFDCPSCNETFKISYSHLLVYAKVSKDGFRFGPWGCDNCGTQVTGTVFSASEVELSFDPEEAKDVKCWDLLVLRPQKYPVYFVVDTKDYSRGFQLGRKSEIYEGKDYYYGEHTCPTNWIKDVECIISEGDTDPHGLFQYVSSVDQETAIKEKSYNTNENGEQAMEPDWHKNFPIIEKE